MKYWTVEDLLGMSGRHIASESHLRIQVFEVPDKHFDLWTIPLGQLLMIALVGETVLKTGGEEQVLCPRDEVLLAEGEQFSLKRFDPGSEAVVQFVWSPGMSSSAR